MTRAISDGGAFVTAGDPRLADVALRRGARAGAQVARLPLMWTRVEPGAYPRATRPTPPTPPTTSPPSTRSLRAAVRARADAAGCASTARPPRYEAPGRWRFAATGTWAPDPGAYGRFAAAAARRYSGRFPDPLHPGAFLPRVRLWQAWNEPNLPRFLQPQWVVRRRRLERVVAGPLPAHAQRVLRRPSNASTARNVVATAGTAPNGDPRDGEGRMTPVRFWQEVLCLGSGRSRRRAVPGSGPFRRARPPPADGHRPGRRRARRGQRQHRRPLQAQAAAALAQRRPRRATRGTRLWITELNWDSGSRGATAAQIQRWVPRALFRLWREGVDLVTWQFVRDPPSEARPPRRPVRDRSRRAARPAPRPAQARRDPRLPLPVHRRPPRPRGTSSCGRCTPHAGAARVTIQRRRGGRWTTLRHVTANRHGLVHAIIALRGGATLRLADPSERRSGSWNAPRR